MDRWINHIAETDADPDLRYAEESHPWKSGILNLGDPELRATADAASVSVSNPLEHVDVHSGGLYIWRVKNGAAVHWRHENYRIFYEKDSFIVLNIRGSRMTGDKPEYALHLWLGKRLSPEDYRLAAYRASLINSSLQYEAVIYREPQGKETSVFRGYFRYLTGEDFRTAFRRIGDELISMFNSAPVLLFTATAAPATQNKLLDLLHVHNPKTVIMNPDRPNIKLCVIKRPPSEHTKNHLDELLEDMGDTLLELKEMYPMTIVYTDTDVIGYSYRFLAKKMGKNQYVGDAIPENRLFGQYHQNYTEKMKDIIVSQLRAADGKLRVVFATVALGMGLDAANIRQIVHYKPPTSLEKYLQEIGRAGRDGQPAVAQLYYNHTDVRPNRPGMTPSMTQYCKQQEKCRRTLLLSYFGHEIENEISSCCDICDQQKECQ